MAERSIAAVLKTVVPRGTGGSNPSLSANLIHTNMLILLFISVVIWLIYETIVMFSEGGLPLADADILAAVDRVGRNNVKLRGHDDADLEYGEYRGPTMPNRVKKMPSILFPYVISNTTVVPFWYESAKVFKEAYLKLNGTKTDRRKRGLGL